MSDLRSKLIRLAHANPEIRAEILPLLTDKTASLVLVKTSPALETMIEGIFLDFEGWGELEALEHIFKPSESFSVSLQDVEYTLKTVRLNTVSGGLLCEGIWTVKARVKQGGKEWLKGIFTIPAGAELNQETYPNVFDLLEAQ